MPMKTNLQRALILTAALSTATIEAADARTLRRAGERLPAVGVTQTDARIVVEQRRTFGERLSDASSEKSAFARDNAGRRVNGRVFPRQGSRLETRRSSTGLLAGAATDSDTTRLGPPR